MFLENIIKSIEMFGMYTCFVSKSYHPSLIIYFAIHICNTDRWGWYVLCHQQSKCPCMPLGRLETVTVYTVLLRV
jgi:hypothetical protein